MSKQLKKNMLTWVKNLTYDYKGVKVKDFHRSWASGVAFCTLIHALDPYAFNYEETIKKKREVFMQTAFDMGEKLGVPALLDVEDVSEEGRPDDKIIITYLIGAYSYYKKHRSEINDRLNDYHYDRKGKGKKSGKKSVKKVVVTVSSAPEKTPEVKGKQEEVIKKVKKIPPAVPKRNYKRKRHVTQINS